MFALVALEQRDGMVARSTPLAWLLLAGGIAFAVPAVTIYSRAGLRDRAGRQAGGVPCVVYVLVGLGLAAILNGVRMALSG
jgi:hypothetical protein